MDFELIKTKLCAFIQEQIQKAQAQGVVLGLSGGLDSALVAWLCKEALKDKIFALLMPSAFSNQNHIQDALMLCEKLKLEYKIIPIQDIVQSFLKSCENPDKIRIGNICARIRMTLLYEYSALKKALVVGTSNKSERMLGYGTIYGDLACAFNPIGSLYKSELFAFAKYLKLPEIFIQKAPSADLYEGQSDEAELGFSYEQIDQALKALECQDEKLLAGLNQELLAMIKQRKAQNAFKLEQAQIAQF